MTWKQLAVLVIPAVALLLIPSGTAQADLITNGGFEIYTGSAPKDFFGDVNPTGWYYGPGVGPGGPLDAINARPSTSFANGTIGIYPGLPATSPNGGNFAQADADPYFGPARFSQIVNGLTPGQQYQLSFYQAAGQQNNFPGSTFEEWIVSFGGDTQTSHRFNLPEGGVGDWEPQTMTFTAAIPAQVLSFLANGSSSFTGPSQPPIIFLDGVSLTATAVPEPTSLFLMGGVLLCLGVAYRRQRVCGARCGLICRCVVIVPKYGRGDLSPRP